MCSTTSFTCKPTYDTSQPGKTPAGIIVAGPPYVLTTDGFLYRFDASGNLLTFLASGFGQPTSFALDSAGIAFFGSSDASGFSQLGGFSSLSPPSFTGWLGSGVANGGAVTDLALTSTRAFLTTQGKSPLFSLASSSPYDLRTFTVGGRATAVTYLPSWVKAWVGTDAGVIQEVDEVSGLGTIIVPGPGWVGCLAARIDSASGQVEVYWGDLSTGDVRRYRYGDGSVALIHDGGSRPTPGMKMAAVSDAVLWTNEGSGEVFVYRDAAGVVPARLFAGGTPTYLAVDQPAGLVYWSDPGTGGGKFYGTNYR
jgi:hypothetical protein